MALVSLSRFRDVNKFFADWNTNWFVTPLGEHPLANRHVEAVQFARGETRIQYKENLLGWSIPKPFPSATFYFFTATTLTICQKERFLEMRHTNGFFFSFLWKFFNHWDNGCTGQPSPHRNNPDQQQGSPHEPPQSTPIHFSLRALLLQTRVARGSPGTDHTTDSQGSHPKEPDARIVQPMCPNEFSSHSSYCRLKTILNLKCSEPDVSGLASRIEKNFSPELSLYSGGLLL